jgi:hypothetical protein
VVVPSVALALVPFSFEEQLPAVVVAVVVAAAAVVVGHLDCGVGDCQAWQVACPSLSAAVQVGVVAVPRVSVVVVVVL